MIGAKLMTDVIACVINVISCGYGITDRIPKYKRQKLNSAQWML